MVKIGLIENCIYVGIYKDIGRAYGTHALKLWMNHETKTDYPVSNYLMMLSNPIKEPITYKPFDNELTFDILFGRISIYSGINFDVLFEQAKAFDLSMEWVSNKEATQAKQKGADFFTIKKRGISLSNGKTSMILGDHFFLESCMTLFTHQVCSVLTKHSLIK